MVTRNECLGSMCNGICVANMWIRGFEAKDNGYAQEVHAQCVRRRTCVAQHVWPTSTAAALRKKMVTHNVSGHVCHGGPYVADIVARLLEAQEDGCARQAHVQGASWGAMDAPGHAHHGT